MLCGQANINFLFLIDNSHENKNMVMCLNIDVTDSNDRSSIEGRGLSNKNDYNKKRNAVVVCVFHKYPLG